ncbi:hypothetical protein [Geodermatophilus marinus]|uniref:hypothetical protein n=1 Tax=Geodermatophilus sp. LHW52908 TaxID=2303986 RepID=UPI000E3BBA4D|nr:hypothetical protein [Geodermatophilus sp. LHW52908]RFU22898.1 hypothetical protein D0Z06_03290 [Geodermatophilus sp. LHW52908]
MTGPALCAGGDHRPPPTGGSCSCGLVTRVPARPAAAGTDLRDLVAGLLGDAPADPHAAADRLLAALRAAGLPLPAGAPERLPA